VSNFFGGSRSLSCSRQRHPCFSISGSRGASRQSIVISESAGPQIFARSAGCRRVQTAMPPRLRAGFRNTGACHCSWIARVAWPWLVRFYVRFVPKWLQRFLLTPCSQNRSKHIRTRTGAEGGQMPEADTAPSSGQGTVWKVINSGIFIWLLTTVVGTFGAFAFKHQIEVDSRISELRNKADQIDLEIEGRLAQFSSWFVGIVEPQTSATNPIPSSPAAISFSMIWRLTDFLTCRPGLGRTNRPRPSSTRTIRPRIRISIVR
jgi:hypothetical protein